MKKFNNYPTTYRDFDIKLNNEAFLLKDIFKKPCAVLIFYYAVSGFIIDKCPPMQERKANLQLKFYTSR
jgi:hypothetical protein